MLLSDVCLSRTSGANSRTERPRKTKIGTVAHVTCDSDTTFKVKSQLVANVLNSQHAETGATWRINAKILSTCRERRHIVSPRAQLVAIAMNSLQTNNPRRMVIGQFGQATGR